MTALPKAACIMPTIRDAWQMGWIFSDGQAERLRRYLPICYLASILPAQPPLKVRYPRLAGDVTERFRSVHDLPPGHTALVEYIREEINDQLQALVYETGDRYYSPFQN